MTIRLDVCAIFMVSAVAILAPAYASEHRVSCASLPAAVRDKGRVMLDGATLHSCQKDVTNGKITFEMELLKSDRMKDVTFDPGGNIVEVEEEIDAASLPGAVASAFEKAAEGGVLGRVESLSRHGRIVSYEATVTRNGRHREIAFHPDGSGMKSE